MKLGKVIVSIMIVAVPFVSFSSVLAANKQQKTVIVAKDQIINNDYFATGNTVEISGTVNGDVYAAGGQIVIDGTVNGDVLAAGGTLTISGTVNGNVRAAAGQVNISGTVSRNVTLGGGTLEVTSAGEVKGNLVAGGGALLVSGKVDKDVTAGAGSLTVTGSVGGKVDAASGQVTVGSSGVIVGPLNYWSNTDASINASAKTGKVTHNQPSRNEGSDTARSLALWSRLYWLLVMLVIGALLLTLLPNHSRAIIKTLETRPWAALGVGFAGLILVPIAAIILLITVIGVPLGLILGVLYAIAIFLAPIWAILVIGDITAKTLKVKNSAFFMLIGGVLVYVLVNFIPIIGGLVSLASLLLGLGAFWLTNMELFKTLRHDAKI